MTQRVFNVEKWVLLDEGQSYLLQSDDEEKSRAVHLEVNAPSRVQLWLLDDRTRLGGEVDQLFLAAVDGRDKVEFYVSGTVRLVVEGGPVWIYTIDGEDVSIETEPSETFTRILERRRRSPEVEAIIREMNFNLERRFAQQANDLGRLVSRSEATRAAQRRPKGDSGGSGAQPVQSSDTGDPERPPAGDV